MIQRKQSLLIQSLQRTNNLAKVPYSASTAQLLSIPSGKGAVRATLNTMRHLVRQYRRNIIIRELALSLVKNVREKNWYGEITRLFEFVRDNIRYVRDINGVETLATPTKTLEYSQGDCDDQATLLAALLESIGHPTRFVALGFNGKKNFSHVLTETKLGNKWISLDTTELVNVGWQPPFISLRMIVDNH